MGLRAGRRYEGAASLRDGECTCSLFPYLAARTVILNDAFPVLALESVAEHVTTVRAIGNRLPDRGSQLTARRPEVMLYYGATGSSSLVGGPVVGSETVVRAPTGGEQVFLFSVLHQSI